MNTIIKTVGAGTIAVSIGVGIAIVRDESVAPDVPVKALAEAGLARDVQTEIGAIRPVEPVAQSRKVPAPDTTRIEQQLAALQEQVDSLSREVAALTVGGTNPLPGPSYADTESADSEDYGAEPGHAALAQQQRIASLGEHLALEGEDTDWAPTAVSTIRDAFASEDLAGISVSDVTCGTSLCRIEVNAGDFEAMMEMEMQLHEKVGPGLPRATMQETMHADGSVTTIVFMAREGHQFPDS